MAKNKVQRKQLKSAVHSKTLSAKNNKPKHTNKSTRTKGSKRSLTWMAQNQLNPSLYNFVDDKKITKLASEVSKFKSKKSSSHFLYVAYEKYYFPYVKTVGLWTDYKKLFKSSVKQVASNLWLHIALRINVFYYLSSVHNKKFRKSKSGNYQTGVRPPLIAFILHTKDKSSKGTGLVKPHFHLAMKFFKKISVKKLSKWIGIKSQNIQTRVGSSKSKQFQWDNMLAYLIHAKQPTKHKYGYEEVKSSGFSYSDYVIKHASKWDNFRLVKPFVGKTNFTEMSHRFLGAELKAGTGTSMRKLLLSDYYFPAMLSKSRNPDDAKALCTRRRGCIREEEALKKEFYRISIFVTGASGSGKTCFCKKVLNKVCKKLGYSKLDDIYTMATGNNPFDDYNMQPFAFFDEARNSNFSATSLIKAISQGKTLLGARYHNKLFIPKAVLITSVQPSSEFFGLVKGQSTSDSIDQFIRRLGLIVKVYPNHRVSLFRIAHFKNNKKFGISVSRGSLSGETRNSSFAEYPRLHSVEKPFTKKSHDQGLYYDKKTTMTNDKAVNIVANLIIKCNDRGKHPKFVKSCFNGGLVTDMDIKDYMTQSLPEQAFLYKMNHLGYTSSSDDSSNNVARENDSEAKNPFDKKKDEDNIKRFEADPYRYIKFCKKHNIPIKHHKGNTTREEDAQDSLPF